jgi:hypothetical protein
MGNCNTIIYYRDVLLGDKASGAKKPTDFCTYLIDKIEYCCDMMKDVFCYDNVFGFSDYYEPTEFNTRVNIYSFSGINVKSTPINVCPFCGQLIFTRLTRETILKKQVTGSLYPTITYVEEEFKCE